MDCFEGTKNVDRWYPVRLLAADGSAVTGKAFGDITCKYGFEAATSETSYSVTADDWKEQGDGNYWLRVGASEFASEGRYVVKIEVAGAVDLVICAEVRDKSTAGLIDDAEIAGAACGAGTVRYNYVTQREKVLASDGVTVLAERERASIDEGEGVERAPV